MRHIELLPVILCLAFLAPHASGAPDDTYSGIMLDRAGYSEARPISLNEAQSMSPRELADRLLGDTAPAASKVKILRAKDMKSDWPGGSLAVIELWDPPAAVTPGLCKSHDYEFVFAAEESYDAASKISPSYTRTYDFYQVVGPTRDIANEMSRDEYEAANLAMDATALLCPDVTSETGFRYDESAEVVLPYGFGSFVDDLLRPNRLVRLVEQLSRLKPGARPAFQLECRWMLNFEGATRACARVEMSALRRRMNDYSPQKIRVASGHACDFTPLLDCFRARFDAGWDADHPTMTIFEIRADGARLKSVQITIDNLGLPPPPAPPALVEPPPVPEPVTPISTYIPPPSPPSPVR